MQDRVGLPTDAQALGLARGFPGDASLLPVWRGLGEAYHLDEQLLASTPLGAAMQSLGTTSNPQMPQFHRQVVDKGCLPLSMGAVPCLRRTCEANCSLSSFLSTQHGTGPGCFEGDGAKAFRFMACAQSLAFGVPRYLERLGAQQHTGSQDGCQPLKTRGTRSVTLGRETIGFHRFYNNI